MTATLSFRNIRLYGYHGIHAEEAKTGNWFTVDVEARLKTGFGREKPDLSNTIDYEVLYKVLKKAFDQRRGLIEEVALNILHSLKEHFPIAENWVVSIEKQDPLGVGNFHPRFTLSE